MAGAAVRQQGRDASDQVEPAWSRMVAVGILGVLIVAFVTSGWWRFTAPFGDNHDGSNAGVWIDAGRAIVELGPLSSRLGSRLVSGGVYAHHPPLIAWIMAVTDWVGGGNAFADRLPLIVGAVACVALLALLLRDLGLTWLAAAGGIAIALGTPMFFVYGNMVDTLPLSLPIGLALLVLWNRRLGASFAPRWLLATAAALCVLSSWEAALLAGVMCLASLVLARRDRVLLRRFVPLFVGAAIGAALVALWLLWASGTFSEVLDQLRTRSGSGATPVGVRESLRLQWQHLGHTMGFVRWLLFPAAIAGLWYPRTRVVMAVLVLTCVAYPLALREAAALHEFWDIWFVAPLAIGLAAIIDAANRVGRSQIIRPVVAIAACVLVVLSLAQSVVGDSEPAQVFRRGAGAGAALDGVKIVGPDIFVVLVRGYNENWIGVRTGAHVKPLNSAESLRNAVRRHPNATILVDCDALGPDLVASCRRHAPSPGAVYAAMPVRVFVRDVVGPGGIH
jgi:Dolichyl-phosphate-mannose-protein mannosyltransferase